MIKEAVNEKTAAAILRKHFHHRPRSINALDGGLSNFVFEAMVGKDSYVIRISDHPAKQQIFLKEQWAARKAREKNVPTPEILEVGTTERGLPFMISRKLAGAPANTFRDRLAVLTEMGKHAAAINSIPTKSYGGVFNWSRNTLSRCHSWKEFLENQLKSEERVQLLEENGFLDAEKLKKLRAELKNMHAWKESPRLAHGDLRLKNVLLDDKGKISAILDWEMCTSAIAPYWELSIALHDLGCDEKEAFLEGYGLDLRRFRELSGPVKALNLLHYATPIWEALHAKDKAALERLRARVGGLYDLNTL